MSRIAALAAALVVAPAATFAGEVVVTGGTGAPTSSSWGFFPTENTGGGSTVITETAPRSGNGSLEMRGDRARFQMGIQYGGEAGATNLGPVSQVLGLSFDWRIAADSTNPYNPDYTPALRLVIQDGDQRSELIWEGVYNNTYGNTARDTWYSSSFSDLFYQNKAGLGVTFDSNGAQINRTLQDWISTYTNSNAFVSAISVGAGSGTTTGYHAFADNVTFATTAGSDTYNFEVTANPGVAAPEPTTWAAMLMGFGALSVAARRRRAASKNSV